MYVQMINALTPMATIVDDSTVAILTQSFASGHFGSNVHQVPKQVLMPLFRLAQLAETVSVLRNDQKVRFGNWGDIPKRQAGVVFVDDVCGDFFPHQLVKQGYLFSLGSLGFCLLIGNLRRESCIVKSDILFDVREVPLEVQRVGLSALVCLQVQADKGAVWWHRRHLFCKPMVEVSGHEAPMSE